MHFNLKPSPIIKRYEFNTRKHKTNKSVSEYVAALRRIAEHCKCCTNQSLNDMLRDRPVCAIADKRVQDRYLREAKLTYAEALVAAETAVKDSEKLHAGCDDSVPSVLVAVTHRTIVQQIRTARSQPSRRPLQRGSPTAHKESKCYRCGGKHDPTRCHFKDYECHYC